MDLQQVGVLRKDDNDYPVMGGTSAVDNKTIINSAYDPVTRRLLVDLGGVGSNIQTDIFVATANQTVFTASGNVAGTFYLSLNGSIQTPSNVDPSGYYTVSGNTATLSSGAVVGSIIIWCYSKT